MNLRIKKILIFSLLLAVSFSLSGRASAQDVYPRLANYFLRWDMTPAETPELAKYDVLVLDAEMQHRSLNELYRLKQLNPDIILLAYIGPQEIAKNASTIDSKTRNKLASGIKSKWYLRNSKGEILSFWPTNYLLNLGDIGTVSDPGWPRYFVDFVVSNIANQPVWDGIFYDNAWEGISWFAPDADVNGDGLDDNNVDADAKWRAGMEFVYDETRRRTPDHFIIMGNSHLGGYQDKLNGKLIEQFQIHDWGMTMNIYQGNLKKAHSPKVSIINTNTLNTGNKNDYRLVRFGLTSTLLEDGYYSFDFGDQSHGQIWWYDEYDVGLGEPLGSAVSKAGHASYQPDVWQRDFENGRSIVNSTNAAQRIDLGGEYEKIHGTQDPVVNDGSIVSEVTVASKDGIILLKTFEGLNDVVFKNGSFVRFFHPDGSRVRNGFFVFEDGYRGGVQIAKIDLNGREGRELLVADGTQLSVWRDDGQLYTKLYPYGTSFAGELRVAVGDITGDGTKEILVAPSEGHLKPIKVYSYDGVQVREDWYPFGKNYNGGYNLDIGRFDATGKSGIVIGTGVGHAPIAHIYDYSYKFVHAWWPVANTFRGGVDVAAGDVNGDGIDEVIVGPGSGLDPFIKIFDPKGNLLYKQFSAYTSFAKPGIDVMTLDVDFDGQDDIVGMSEGI